MGEILTAMMRTHDVATRTRDAAEGLTRPWCVGADVFLNERPCGFNGIEVVRVRRQQFHAGSATFDDGADHRRFMGVQVIKDDDIAWPEVAGETAAHPLDKRLGVAIGNSVGPVLLCLIALTQASLKNNRVRELEHLIVCAGQAGAARPAAGDVDDAQLVSGRFAYRRSGRAAFVVMMETVQMRVGDDRTGPRRLDGARRGRILVQGQVRPDPMVVIQVELKRSSESPFIPHDDVIETFPPGVPIRRSAKGFCHGDRGAMRSSSMSNRFKRSPKAGP